MRILTMLAAAVLTGVCATAALAQQVPATSGNAMRAARPPQAPLQIPDPHYSTVSLSITVNAPADTVWARVGKFCDIGEWLPSVAENGCKYLSGTGDAGTVRSVGNEVLVGKTKYGYTYAQAPRENTLYNFYHGTLEVVPVTATTSRLNYVLFFDTSMLGNDAAREKALKSRQAQFTQGLQNMKTLAEGGKLPVVRASAHPPAADGTPLPAYQNANPHYVAVPMQLDVSAPADVVWQRIGHFCDIGKLGAAGFPTCMIVSGTDGEYGVVRNVGREVLVGRTAHSYTYAQQMRASGFYSLYHGTIEARAVTPNTSTLYWTLVYDNSNLADDAARERDVANRRTRFMRMMQNVKILSEGGTLPPDPVVQPVSAAPAPSR